MLSKLKSYLLVIIIAVLAALVYWHFYSAKWVIVIDKGTLWEHKFQNDENWEKADKVKLKDKETNKLILQSFFTLKDETAITEAVLSLNNKYSAEIYINGKLCVLADGNLINHEINERSPSEIEIVEYWRARKVKILGSQLRECLQKGENNIQVHLTSYENIKEVECNKSQLLFLQKGNANDFKTDYKVEKPQRLFSESVLPIFKINTDNKSIPDEPKIQAYLNISSGDSKNQLSNSSFGCKIKIERRGNTSQSFSKKSYSFNVYNNEGGKDKQGLLGLPESHKWVLYGPYADKSLIRNALTYSLYAKMGNYAPRFHLVELVINNDYRGIYMLTEKIQLGSNHLDIEPLSISQKDTTKAAGGYLLEIDRNKWKAPYPIKGDTSAHALYYGLYAPKATKINKAIEKQIKKQYFEFEHHLYNQQNIYDYVDIESFIDYLIITEVSKNIDGYRLSTFMYNPDINAELPKFYIGPIWDYNFSFGLTNYNDGFNPEGMVYNIDKFVPFWWHTLLSDDTFHTRLKERYTELRKSVLSNENMRHTIDSLSGICESSVENNFAKWTVLGGQDFWPNYFLGKTYKEEINYLKDWADKRLKYLDNVILASDGKNVRYYEVSIWNNSEWMKKVKDKAKEPNISVEEMVNKDVKYMVEKQHDKLK